MALCVLGPALGGHLPSLLSRILSGCWDLPSLVAAQLLQGIACRNEFGGLRVQRSQGFIGLAAVPSQKPQFPQKLHWLLIC